MAKKKAKAGTHRTVKRAVRKPSHRSKASSKSKVIARSSKKSDMMIIGETIVVSPKIKAAQYASFSNIPTEELEKLQAHGLLPFEMRKELEKRKR